MKNEKQLPADYEYVDHPQHYRNHPSGVEAIELCEVLTFNLGNAFKYVYRRGDKGNTLQDLNKAVWYLDREIVRLSRYGWMPAIFQGMFKVNPEFSPHHEGLAMQVRSFEKNAQALKFYTNLLVAGSIREVLPLLENAKSGLNWLIINEQTPDAPRAS